MNLQQFNTTIINATYKYNNNNYEIDYKPCGPELTCFDTQTKTNISTNAWTINQKDNSCSSVLGYVYGANTQVNLAYSKNLHEWQIEYNNPKGNFSLMLLCWPIIYFSFNDIKVVLILMAWILNQHLLLIGNVMQILQHIQ